MVFHYITNKLIKDKPVRTKGKLLELEPRCKGDLAISRLKMKDLIGRFDKENITWAENNICHLDVILVTNLMIWAQIWGLEKLKALHATGILNSFEEFATLGSKVSAYVKRFPFDKNDCKARYAEINTLTGYLQNDFGNFDYDKEFEALATGDSEHPEWWKEVFVRKLDQLMTHQEHKKYVSFEEYVKEGMWITSGSSSIGKVDWSYDGDTGKFKARKNMILDLYTKEELYDLAINWDGNLDNRVFIKDELAKRRLAVASNIEAYLNQGYLYYLFGHGFKNWKYITLDETPGETHNRNCDTVAALKDGCFALPFDFKGFDRQPTIWEVKQITKKVISQIKYMIPEHDRIIFNKIAAKNISCYDNNYLYSPLTKETKKQTNGIPSGIRPTSFIGNVWNMTTTDIARDQTNLILGKDNIRLIALKGDDTKILAKDFLTCLVFRYSYQAINAIGENSKFGIMQNCCEFLRTEISTSGVRGWCNRAIPSVTQRKPWNPQPWTANQQVETTANNIYLLERRTKMDLSWLHQANKIKWSKFTEQSYHWLHLPKHLGGFGIYEWQGWNTLSKLPLADIPTFDVPNLIQDSIDLKWLKMNSEEKRKYQKVEFSAKIAADDIPGPQKFISMNYIRELRKIKTVWFKEEVPEYRIYKIEGPTAENRIWPRNQLKAREKGPEGMPMFSEFIRQHQTAKKAKIKVPSLKECLSKWYPDAYNIMVESERKGWHRTDAINLAAGKVPLEPTKILNPILTPWISKIAVKSGLLQWRGRRNIALRLTSVCKQAVRLMQDEGGKTMYAF